MNDDHDGTSSKMDESDTLEPTLDQMIRHRYLVATQPSGRPMQMYFRLEEREEEARCVARERHLVPLALWLRFLSLFGLAFSRTYYDFDDDLSKSEARAKGLAIDLLGLSGTTSKPAVDALVVGYYSQAYALIRTMLETWRRAVYLRVHPQGVDSWWPEHDELDEADISEIVRLRPPDAKQIAAALNAIGSHDLDAALDLIGKGIKHMHAGAHPSVEAVTQLWNESGGRVFGPNYKKEYCEFGLQWGLIANLFLVNEIHALIPQPSDWEHELDQLDQEVRNWMKQFATTNSSPGDDGP